MTTGSVPYEEDYSKRLAIIREIINRADASELLFINDSLATEFRARYERVIGMKAQIANLEEERCIDAFMCEKRRLPTKKT